MAEITEMRSEHIHQVALIEKECFSVPWSEKSLEEELHSDVAHFFVCVEGDEVLGYGGIHIMSGECYVDNIAVKSSRRRQGIGDILTRKLVETAREKDGEFISLEVRMSNTPAHALYEKHGFINVGVRKNFYDEPTEDAIIMTKTF